MCPTSPPTSTAFSKGSARFVYKPWLDLQAHFIFPIPPLRVLVLLLHSQANKLHHWSTNSPAPIIFFIFLSFLSLALAGSPADSEGRESEGHWVPLPVGHWQWRALEGYTPYRAIREKGARYLTD